MLKDENNPFYEFHSLKAKYATDEPIEYEATPEQDEKLGLLMNRIQTLLRERKEKERPSETSEE